MEMSESSRQATGLPRGMRDVYGAEIYGIRRIRDTFEKMAALYGYTAVQPSPLELLSVLETKSGPAIRDEIYDFKDKGGRDVGLRFDFTMGLTRHVAANRSMPLPAKMSCFGGVFRYDEPQKGRYRYFHQWDIEIYGKPHIRQDAEIIDFTARLFDALNIRVNIRISHRALMEYCITRIVDASALPDMFRAADKLLKKSPEDIIQEFSKKGYDRDVIRRVLRLAKIRGTDTAVEKEIGKGVRGHDSWAYLKKLYGMVSQDHHNIQIDLGVVRGLDYYTGVVFEVFGAEHGALAGGGRYDVLPGVFGRDDLGAAGVAGGVERILQGMRQGPPESDTVSIVYHKTLEDEAATLAGQLRAADIPVRIDISGKPFKKQMAAAGRSRYAVIIMPKENATGEVILKDIIDTTQQSVPYEDIATRLAELLGIRSGFTALSEKIPPKNGG